MSIVKWPERADSRNTMNDKITVRMEFEIPEDSLHRIPLLELLKQDVSFDIPTPVPEDFKEKEAEVDESNFDDSYTSSIVNEVEHYVLQGLHLFENSYEGEHKDMFITSRQLYDTVPSVRRQCDEYKNSVQKASGVLSQLYKDGMVSRILLETDGRGRPPYGYRLSKKGRAILAHMGKPESEDLSYLFG